MSTEKQQSAAALVRAGTLVRSAWGLLCRRCNDGLHLECCYGLCECHCREKAAPKETRKAKRKDAELPLEGTSWKRDVIL